MSRIDLHIVRTSRGWLVQNANARTLGTFGNIDAAVAYGEAAARQVRMRGVDARVTIHPPGKRSKVIDFPAVANGIRIESYALSRCGLS